VRSNESKSLNLYNLICNRSFSFRSDKLSLVDCVGLNVGAYIKKDLKKRASLSLDSINGDGDAMGNICSSSSHIFSSCINLLNNENLCSMPKCCESLI
jgi:hypothetical protein